ncbi:MAG: cellulose synthase catalytic subunit, partial [Pseudomonadota bacterium]
YLVASYAMQNYLYGKVRWPWVSELYEYVQSVMLFGSIVSVVRNPRKPTFNVTAKGQTLDKSGISPIAKPYFAIFFILLTAAVYGVWRYFTEPLAGDLLMIVLSWNMINLALAGAALGVVSERRELRRNQRLPVKRHALMRIENKLYSIIVSDASSGGIAVEFVDGEPALDPAVPLKGYLELRRGGQVLGADMVMRGTRKSGEHLIYGFAYCERTPQTFAVIAELMYSDQSVLQDRLNRRQVRIGYFAGTFRFAIWTFTETFRALRYSLGWIREQEFSSQPDAPIRVHENGATVAPVTPPLPAVLAGGNGHV